MQRKVRAAVLHKKCTPLIIEELTLDEPRTGEVLVKIDSAGICASDHHVIEGTAKLPMPVVIGHEGAGTVVETGIGTSRVRPGERCILSFISNCGYCKPCLSGSPHLCDTHRETGPLPFDGTARLHYGKENVYQMQKLGVFSEYAVVPENACRPIPDSISMDVAALIGCSVTTGVGGVINQPGIRTGGTVAVFGCGGVGLNAVQGARLLNSRKIIAVDILDHKLEFSYKFGATDVINSRHNDVLVRIQEITDGEGVDYAFDTFGSTQTTAQAFESVRKGGTAVVIGLPPVGDRAPIDLVDMVRNEKKLVGSFYGSSSPHATFGQLVDFYLREKIDIDSLITRRYQLDQINDGFSALARGEDGRGIVVFD